MMTHEEAVREIANREIPRMACRYCHRTARWTSTRKSLHPGIVCDVHASQFSASVRYGAHFTRGVESVAITDAQMREHHFRMCGVRDDDYPGRA